MASFQFVAKDSTGQELRGTIDADDRESAIAGIRAHGLTPTAIGEVKSGTAASKKPASAQKPASAPMPRAAPMSGHDSVAPNQMDAKSKERKLEGTGTRIFLLAICPIIGYMLFMKWFMSKIKRMLLNQEPGLLPKSCKIYACSVFVIGLIVAIVLVVWASPENSISVHYKYPVRESLEYSLDKWKNTWDPSLLTTAVWHLVASFLWGCFILSQVSCSIKMRERQVVAGSAPVHLLIVSCLCLVLVVLLIAGLVSIVVKAHGLHSAWYTYLASLVVNPFTWMRAPPYCHPETAIVLSAFVAIWHFLGSSFVAMLIRENIAKVRSLENEGDRKNEG